MAGLFDKIKRSLKKTSESFIESLDDLLGTYEEIDEDFLEELEEILIMADMGAETTEEVMTQLEHLIYNRLIRRPKEVVPTLKEILQKMIQVPDEEQFNWENPPKVLLIIGVNGAGKTTSIGKLAKLLKSEGKSVLMAAGDTFRAAAIEQLQIWADRAGVDLIKQQEGSDPASVIFDAIAAQKSRGIDVLLCDSAGRLHNKKNLMRELEKITRIITREYPREEVRTLLVLDSTTGQNALNQAVLFKEYADMDGIILTKLDGTAKGGFVFSIKQKLGVPVLFVATGEQIDDMAPFDAASFVDGIFSSDR